MHFISGKLGTIVQITVCQSTVDPRRIVIFANTHLFFHPAAAFARLLQTDVIISTCMYVRQCIQTQGLDCFKDLKINGEEIIEDYNDNNNDNDDDNGGKDESEQSIIMALKKLELGNNLRNSTPLPLPLLPDSTPVSVSIMLLGDLNSTPETAVIEYFKTYVHTHAHKHTHIHTHTHMHTHTHTCTQTQTHTHTHTRTHALLDCLPV